MTFCEEAPDKTTAINEQNDPEMEELLEQMLDTDETITARAVARKHPEIKHASSITRSASRSTLLAEYQKRQEQFRGWVKRIPKRSREQVAADIAQKDARIADLERQLEILQVSHQAMLRAVGELGGMNKWRKFYEGFREIRNQLLGLGAKQTASVPDSSPSVLGNVLPFPKTNAGKG